MELQSVEEVNLMEREAMKIVHERNTFEVPIKPYEIKSFRIRFDSI
ncbi:glycosyl hydrolase-related protein [Cohnella nanjingensis]